MRVQMECKLTRSQQAKAAQAFTTSSLWIDARGALSETHQLAVSCSVQTSH